MSSSASTLRLYRNILRTAQNWPIFDFMNAFLQTADELADATCEVRPRVSAGSRFAGMVRGAVEPATAVPGAML